MNPMLARILVTQLPLVVFGFHAADTHAKRVATVTRMPGCVAFWDFVKREPEGRQRFTAHVPWGATNDFPLDAGNCNMGLFKLTKPSANLPILMAHLSFG